VYTVYVLRSDLKDQIYIGHTDRIKQRLIEHQTGSNRSTQGVLDWKLIYEEDHVSRSLAMKREKFLKTGDGRKVLKNKGII